MNDRVLVYTCCDSKYSHFIPIFVASLLFSNKNIDVEIGVDISSLDEKEEKSLDRLRKMYPESKILIKYNFFKNENGKGIYNGKKVILNSIRFISEPVIKNRYTYISDIDIVSLDENFYLQHLKNIKDNNLDGYSNIVRPNTTRMTGLHFCESSKHYPLILPQEINLTYNDEMLLHDIMKLKGIKIDYNAKFRPVHGIHFSLNRPYVGGNDKIPGWGAEPYRKAWNEFTHSDTYKAIQDSFSPMIISMIKKLETFYN